MKKIKDIISKIKGSKSTDFTINEEPPTKYKNPPQRPTTVIGSMWGDEGKGKITNYLARQADIVVRYQGGNNAGHTIVINDEKFITNLLPSGAPLNKISILADGMVIDPFALVEEIKMLNKQLFGEGGDKEDIVNEKIFISPMATLILPHHKILDGIKEENRKKEDKIGTTRKGISEAYADKTLRTGLRIADLLLDYNDLLKKVENAIEYPNIIIEKFNPKEVINAEKLTDKLEVVGKVLRPYIVNTTAIIRQYHSLGKKIVYEGAQGVLLDINYGMYPFVTSSSTTAIAVGSNVGIGDVNITNGEVVGVVKAYSTRIGAGAFPSELQDEKLADDIRDKGNEFGTVTGRPRRIGWLDIPLLNYVISVSGINNIALTLLDVLSDFEKIKIVDYYTNSETGEVIDGKELLMIDGVLEKMKPHYLELEGWSGDISDIKVFENLPRTAREFVEAIEELTGVKVGIISVGKDIDQTIMF